ncbi:HlyD family efflux transporter periplasmic adaptor subunit [Aliifodinibius sp. S!AR15-10]|uniref:HlyD family secretion protein n=1 Tax=Aliifodinibius sp. S!AR15-10 TaxID=2950437 RepID=UPI00285DD38D|nr:HlyD family efflux transporter periplasmic adaptor subunit [Aliifodinibius sp. S!AR15-10]MDR8393325.1 HlyD family efflux transporter periplasmic adaptor subunit [Aliifodinibius sp. S!AR15-10]
MSENFEPIRIPWKQRLQELRVRGVPVLVFLVVAGVVAYLWSQRIHSPEYMGKVVGERSVITSPERGRWVNFRYSQFDEVKQGDLLGEIVITDTALVNARLDVIRQRMIAIREQMTPAIDNQRAQIDFEGLRVELMNQRITLAQTELQLQRAKTDFKRSQKLYQDSVISDRQYDSLLTEVEMLEVQKQETEKLIQELQNRIEELNRYNNFGGEEPANPVMAAINVQQKELRAVELELEPRPLYAPMDGVISRIHQPNGAYVDAGSLLLEVESKQPQHIVGYVRQPFKISPEVGMKVQVQTRRPGRESFTTNIVNLGGQVRLIEPGLQRPGMTTESGLPVEISYHNTSDIDLRPGEIVDFELLH